MLDKQGYTHAHAHAPRAPRARGHACTLTNTKRSDTYFFSRLLLRESASVLRYTYIACLVQDSSLLQVRGQPVPEDKSTTFFRNVG